MLRLLQCITKGDLQHTAQTLDHWLAFKCVSMTYRMHTVNTSVGSFLMLYLARKQSFWSCHSHVQLWRGSMCGTHWSCHSDVQLWRDSDYVRHTLVFLFVAVIQDGEAIVVQGLACSPNGPTVIYSNPHRGRNYLKYDLISLFTEPKTSIGKCLGK